MNLMNTFVILFCLNAIAATFENSVEAKITRKSRRHVRNTSFKALHVGNKEVGDKHIKKRRRSLSYSRSDYVWEIINTMDSYKQGRHFSKDDLNRSTLTSFHYLVLPIWWKDETTVTMPLAPIREALDGAVENHFNQSWGKFKITYDILPQEMISKSMSNPNWYSTMRSCRDIIQNQGLVEGEDYDGIIMVHNLALSGRFSYRAGYGELNGNFITMSAGKLTDCLCGIHFIMKLVFFILSVECFPLQTCPGNWLGKRNFH